MFRPGMDLMALSMLWIRSIDAHRVVGCDDNSCENKLIE